MYIHNFYSDLLLSIRVLFDNHIFQNRDYVKRYEFNMGNRALQLPIDYKPNFEFPNLIVTINDEVASFGQRPDVSQKIPGYNLDQIPVLYDQTTNVVLLVQEEMVQVPFSIVINCESQFQAKEISAQIRRWLPVNKYIQFLTFVSYLEVSPELLSSENFNPSCHNISNIYTKLNKNTGDIDFCYALQYEPFIRLDSISTNIPDSTQRSFQVNVEISYMIQMPLYMFSDQSNSEILKIDISINPTAGFEPICDYPSTKIVNRTNLEITNIEKGFIRRVFVVTPDLVTSSEPSIDSVSLEPDQITNISEGGSNISATVGSDEYIYVTVGANPTTFKVSKSLISNPDDIRINIDSDYYLIFVKDLAGKITITLYKTSQNITIQFDKSDLVLTNQYSYNLIKGNIIYRDFPNFILNTETNSIIFYFSNIEFSTYKPTITNPLLVQFYLKEENSPFQIGGIQSYISLINVLNIRQTAVEIIFLTKELTTTQIEYGTTTDYGSLSILTSDLTYSHHLVLSGLIPGENYHFRVKVIDENETEYLSEDCTFTTLE